jgi:hypothetical protein
MSSPVSQSAQEEALSRSRDARLHWLRRPSVVVPAARDHQYDQRQKHLRPIQQTRASNSSRENSATSPATGYADLDLRSWRISCDRLTHLRRCSSGMPSSWAKLIFR